MLVAMDEDKPVGVIGLLIIRETKKKIWCVHGGKIGYVTLLGVLPEYSGRGIATQLFRAVDDLARQQGMDKILGDTDVRNKSAIRLLKKMDYKVVDYICREDHESVYILKWLDGCPFSWWRIKYHYIKSRREELKKKHK